MQILFPLMFLGIAAYLFGSVPFGKLYGRWFRDIDIQQHGSGNIGFANACRVLGWRLGVAVLASDVLKSLLPLLAAKLVLDASQPTLLLMGALAVLGHAFPVWLKFKGGKSIATGLGALLVIAPLLALCGLAVYCLLFSIVRMSAISSIAGAWSLPLVAAIAEPKLLAYCLGLALFATYTHRSNIKQLALAYVD